MRKITVGEWGWAGLFLYVVAVDTQAWRHKNESMSCAFGRHLQSTKGRLWCAAIWGGLTLHLFYSLPIPGQTKLKTLVTGGYRTKNHICMEQGN